MAVFKLRRASGWLELAGKKKLSKFKKMRTQGEGNEQKGMVRGRGKARTTSH